MKWSSAVSGAVSGLLVVGTMLSTPITSEATPTLLTGRNFVVIVQSTWTDRASVIDYKSMIVSRGGVCNIIAAGYGTGQTAANAIRTDLITRYAGGSGITDVLFIGDPDPATGDVPMYNYNAGTEVIPSDWYYSDIVGTFPNRTAELRVGRIPIYGSDGAKLDAFLAKTHAYVDAINVEWRRFALLPAVPLAFDITRESYTFMDEMHTSLSSDGWGTYRMVDSYSWKIRNHLSAISRMTIPADEYYCNYANVPPTWNRLDPGLVVWGTHGYSRSAFDVIYSGIISTGNGTDLLDNTYPAAVLALSCATADPKDHENLGMNTLMHNAIAYIGATFEIADVDLRPLMDPFVARVKDNLTINYIDALNQAKALDPGMSFKAVCGVVFYGCTDVCLNLPELSSSTAIPQPVLTSVEADEGSDPNSAILLSWTPVTGQGVTAYGIEFGVQGTDTRATVWTTLPDVTGEMSGTYLHTGRASGTTYLYRIYAKRGTDRSGYSRIDSASTYVGDVDQRPGNISSILFDGVTTNCITTKWTAAANATYYIVERSIGLYDPFAFVGTTAALRFEDRNIINNMDYFYRVAAVNEHGIGNFTPGNIAAAAPAVPYMPTISAVDMVSTSTIADVKVDWTPPAGIAGLGYYMYYARSLPEGQWMNYKDYKDPGTPGPLRFTTSQNIPDLDGNVDYKFAVSMLTYTGSGTEQTSALTETPPFRTYKTGVTPPATPTSLWVGPSLEPEKIRFTWSKGGATAPDGYVIFRKQGTGSWQLVEYIESTGPDMEVEYDASPIQEYFCVQAYDEITGNERVFSAYPTAADGFFNPKLIKPLLLPSTVTQTTTNSYLISAGSATSWTYYRSTDGTNFTPLPGPYEITASFDDLTCLPSTTYWYKVVAHAPGYTDSDPSNLIEVTTLAVPPQIRFYMADQTFTSNQQSQIRFAISNLAGGGSLSNFVVRYYFTVENGKTPGLGDYWTPNCNPTLEYISGNQWCVKLAYGGTLPPGGRIPAYDGQLIGLYYTDWSPTWNKFNDFSQPASSSMMITNKVAVYNSEGELVYGSVP